MTPHHPTATRASGGIRPTLRLRQSFANDRRRRERRVRALQHDERFDRLRTLPARRILVVVGYLLAGASAAVELTDLPGVVAPALFLLGLGVAFLLYRVVRHIVDAPDEALDERLVALRDAAYRTAYHIVVWAMLAVLFGLMLGAGAALDVQPHHLQALVWVYALAAVLTPVAVVAWREREV